MPSVFSDPSGVPGIAVVLFAACLALAVAASIAGRRSRLDSDRLRYRSYVRRLAFLSVALPGSVLWFLGSNTWWVWILGPLGFLLEQAVLERLIIGKSRLEDIEDSGSTLTLVSGQASDRTREPGWYSDPIRGYGMRRWDGTAWTEDVDDESRPITWTR